MTEEEMIEAAQKRYMAAAHAMQTGVSFMMERHPQETDPKHMRVGVNSAMVENAALVDLLIEKGVFTSVEFIERLASTMEDEVAIYTELVNATFPGGNITLK